MPICWDQGALDNLAGGLTEDEIIEQYPSLTRADIHASLTYAAELAHDP
ncbi:MAG: DUF433 domain-containing protein [Candidatus Dormibacteria bacterium]